MPDIPLKDREVHVLQALLSQADAASRGNFAARPAASEGVRALAGYAWSDSEHRVVYECLAAWSGRGAASLREYMAAQATRMGHPDVDWALYWTDPGPAADATSLAKQLSGSRPPL